MNKLIRALLAGLIALPLLLVPTNVGAAGLGVGPGKGIEITDALRGREYYDIISVKYINESDCAVELSATGDISEWVSFYELGDPTTPIESMIAPAREWTYVRVKFNIPEDAAIGTATGTLYVTTMTPEVESGQAVSFQGRVDVTITVTGTMILTGVVSSIGTGDVELGYPLQIKVGFQNTGNVVVTPQIDVEITRDDAAIDSFSYAETEVKPKSSETISLEWDTTGKEPGDYVGRVAVSLGEEVIATRELNFAILPVGTLTRAGVFEELALEGNPKLGTIAKVQATFFNTGQIDTRARFIGEVYCDNELVDTLESEETLVPVRQKDVLTSYVKPEKPGNYNIKGYINYEGKKTEVKEISFALSKATGEASQGRAFNLLSPAAIGVIVVLIGVIIFMLLRRRGKAA